MSAFDKVVYNSMNYEIDNSVITDIQILFLKTVCKNIVCGSQCCDGSVEWLEGCQRYQRFKNDIFSSIHKLIEE